MWGRVLAPAATALDRIQGRVCLTGLVGASPGLMLCLLARLVGPFPPGHRERSWLVVTETEDTAQRTYEDLHFFCDMLGLPTTTLCRFPSWETLPYETTPPNVDVIGQRMRTLHRMASGDASILVASVPAVLQRVLPRRVLLEASWRLTPGQTVEREPLVSRLLRLGYRRVSAVEIPGEFSIRGGIVDLYSTAYAEPVRAEFLGDTVESLRCFDPSTQKSTTTLEEAWLLPAREAIRPEDHPDALAPLPPDAEWRSPDLYPLGSPSSSPSLETLFDYCSGTPILALDQPTTLGTAAEAAWEHINDGFLRHEQADGGNPYPSPDRLFLSWPQVLTRTNVWAHLALEPLVASGPQWDPVVPIPVQSPQSAGLAQRGTPFTESLTILNRLREAGPVVLVARSRGQVDRLLALFGEHDLPAVRWTPQQWTGPRSQKAPFAILQGEVSAGFVTEEGSIALITEEELFAKGMRHRPQAKSKAAAFLASLEDLKVGDYVVHMQHGIARYQGLRRLTVQDYQSDYLILEFGGGDKLYVPLDRLNQVQRYSRAEGHVPRLDKLGGTSWAKTTARVKKDIEEMAHELVTLYANRELVQRTAYGEDSTLTHEFEAAFEYEETTDQLKAIEDIKQDMEASKPMDRLVCGDVGYGKTEVAMRAAFKAIEDNRQVAVLVPTTILGQQHYDNFTERFAPFPTKVALLSRFQTPKESKAILKGVAEGTIDILIGTHRILQSSVAFRNLGLVIIDEEQWFGVKHKERLKQLRTHVDVLTLTATPIPRTLQMAMAGVRDLSIIETPPIGRLAIKSHVVRFSDTVVREAMVRELGRGGQVYFVHNRVETMEQMGAWLGELVPEARIVMAHGQMPEHVLESVMLKFLHQQADVLLCSAIIQSGLDVSNANTILVNRADMFGLAQLYQLRGRVGRSGQQAYAYFFIPDESALSTDAQKRLRAIQELTELGAGFRIAAADLEIRGSGNLLGKQQSGHIQEVGLDLYMRMVEEAVHTLRGQVVEEAVDPTLHLPVSAFIPEDYVSDDHQRLALYKRLSSAPQVGDLAILHGEIQDRYGPVPDSVERLVEVMQVRMLAKALKATSIEVKAGALVVTFAPKHGAPETGMRQLMDRYKRRLQIRSPHSFELALSSQEWSGAFPEVIIALQTMLFCVTKKST